jgi:hypothetical protein
MKMLRSTFLKPHSLVGSWLPDMDLNHDKQIQSLLCYRYTIGQTNVTKLGVSSAESRLQTNKWMVPPSDTAPVAQTSLYRGFPIRKRHLVQGPADWKSAIQQVGNLRYGAVSDCVQRMAAINPLIQQSTNPSAA